MKRKIFKILRWTGLLVYIFVIMSFISRERNNLHCTDFKIIIDENHAFVNDSIIKKLLKENDIAIDSCLITDIDFDKIEKIIEQNPAVKSANIYSNFTGEVYVDIKQRNPIMRIITKDNFHYYVDSERKIMPVSLNYTANVPVVNGAIDKTFVNYMDSSDNVQNNITNYPFTAKDLFDFITYLNNDELWKYQIEQIYINENKDIELIPRVGKHIIILGDLNNYEYKLNKLVSLYKNGFSGKDWETYTSINLKYSNQVICKKK